MGEPDLHELLDVERSVPVPSGADGLGEHHARGVRRLPDTAQVDPPGDLADEHGSQSLRSELLVDAQEVDLRQVQLLSLDRQLGGYAGDERDQLTRAHHPHAQVPVLNVPRGLEHPLEELARVLEPEHGVVVLDVVVVEELEDLIVHLLVRYVARAPLERRWQVVPLLLHLVDRHRVVDRALGSGFIELGLELAHRLGLPEGVVLHVVEGHAGKGSASLLGQIRGRGTLMVLVRHDATRRWDPPIVAHEILMFVMRQDRAKSTESRSCPGLTNTSRLNERTRPKHGSPTPSASKGSRRSLPIPRSVWFVRARTLTRPRERRDAPSSRPPLDYFFVRWGAERDLVRRRRRRPSGTGVSR